MSEPLRAGIEAINAAAANADESQQIVAAKCRALLVGYEKRWGWPDFEVLGVEQLVQSDLYNPATTAKSRTFTVAAKLDLIAQRNGRRVLFDHKTTSEDIKDPNSTYWRQLIVEAQPSHYMLLEWLNSRKVDEAVWDVMRKPDIRPKNIAKKDREYVYREGVYFGRRISDESIREMETTERETLEMYESRLAYDCVTDRPEHYFQRRTVPRLDADIHEHAVELWDYAQEIILARRLNRHPRNSGACMDYNRPCAFLGICSGHDEPNSINWRTKQQVHKELDLIDTDGRGILTNSRLTAFKTCRRKHFYSYEFGIERVQEDESESLYFGTLWHQALEAYFREVQKGQDGNNSTGSSVNEADTADTIAAEA